ncbi:DNA methyltransferase [Rhizobium leguminosarum]
MEHPPLNTDLDVIGGAGFKEDAVREEVVFPLLVRLGYASSGDSRIVRSRAISHPFVAIGSTRRPITIIPDYLLEVGGRAAWVLDAKAPNENITTGQNVEQAFSYAIHPEIRASLFALCNGREFALFRVEERDPLLHFKMGDLEAHWRPLFGLIGPQAFRDGPKPISITQPPPEPETDYLAVNPPAEVTQIAKQAAKRHHGVHGYFTRQVWSVVQAYIERFSKPGDVVLDPFGGTGVTLIESLILGRKGIHVDINPLSQFIVQTLISSFDPSDLVESYQSIRRDFENRRPENDEEVEALLERLPFPSGIELPKNADVRDISELFSRRQLAELALLKSLVLGVKNAPTRAHLLLMFSGLLNKINLTYHASEGRSEGRGDSAVFRYYRYRIAHTSPSLDVLRVFESRLRKILAAKEELRPFVSKANPADYQVLKGSATNLAMVETQSVDYIYTDPPYGSKIPYLDLSVMWNAWLDLTVTRDDFAQEAIEGGELGKTKGDYSALLAQSINEMYRVLKFGRWMSFVFAHKDPAYWHLIVGAAEAAGFEYAGVTKQNNGQSSFKKRQNPFTVLSGQLIINFKKVKNPRSIMAVELGMDIADVIEETIEASIALHHGATIEQINDDLVIRGLELGFLHILSKQYQDLTPLLRDRFMYDEAEQKYHIKRNTKFKAHIDVRMRIRYFLLSYMRRMEMQKIRPSFDDIVLSIMPLLKNGITPEHQTIQSVLEDIAEPAGVDRWRLKNVGQGAFDF